MLVMLYILMLVMSLLYYIIQLVLLPDTGGVREAFTNHFVRTLKLKAVSICKYLESEL